jgi:hypothetical protein
MRPLDSTRPERTGLDMHKVASVHAFAENSAFVDPDLDELTESIATSEWPPYMLQVIGG